MKQKIMLALCIAAVVGGLFFMLKSPVEHYVLNPMKAGQAEAELAERGITADEIEANLAYVESVEASVDSELDLADDTHVMSDEAYVDPQYQEYYNMVAEDGFYDANGDFYYYVDILDEYGGYYDADGNYYYYYGEPVDMGLVRDYAYVPEVSSDTLVETPSPVADTVEEGVSEEVRARMTSPRNPAADGLYANGEYRANGTSYRTAESASGHRYPVSEDPNISYDNSNVNQLDRIPMNASIDWRYVVGQIYMPDVQMYLPLLEGVSNENLWVGAGTMKPGQEMGRGNYALAGHHMYDPTKLFTPIMNAKIGHDIYLSDGGHVYHYKVSNLETVGVERGDVISNARGDGIVTLVVCTDVYGTARYIVTGTLERVMPMSSAPEQVQYQFGAR